MKNFIYINSNILMRLNEMRSVQKYVDVAKTTKKTKNTKEA